MEPICAAHGRWRGECGDTTRLTEAAAAVVSGEPICAAHRGDRGVNYEATRGSGSGGGESRANLHSRRGQRDGVRKHHEASRGGWHRRQRLRWW